MPERRRPGAVRDAIHAAFDKNKKKNAQMTVGEIRDAVSEHLGEDVPSSSVRSYLNLNTPGAFLRTERGTYRRVLK